MPRDIPGFDWDPHRNRYFPISTTRSSFQPPQVPPTNNNYSLSSDNPIRRPRSIWQLTNLRKSELLINSTRHDLFGLHVARTSCVTQQRVPTFGEIRNFISTTTRNGQSYRLMGDSQGWLYTSRNQSSEWVVEANLDTDSEISSLNICQNTYSLATSFGPVSKIRVHKLDDPNLSFVITTKHAHDIRCSEYSNPNEIIVGANQHAVYLTDIFNQPKTRILNTQSDVFSVTRQHDLIYAGTRNGSIHRFDLRILRSNSNRCTTGTKSTTILSSPGSDSNSRQQQRSRNGSTVLHMQLIDDVHFLTSYMNGEILMYDIRYTQRGSTPNPVLRFPGHINTHTSRLGIVVDSTPSLLFAAGQDRKIRGWSIRTGEPLLPPPSSLASSLSSNSHKNPLSIQFSHPIETLQITSSNNTSSSKRHNQPDLQVFTNHPTTGHEGDSENENESKGSEDEIGGGMCLWAGCGNKLYRFDLGCMQRVEGGTGS